MRKTVEFGRIIVVGMVAAALAVFAVSPASADSRTAPPAVPREKSVAAPAALPPLPADQGVSQSVAAATGVCARAHMQNIGWEVENCAAAGAMVVVGRPGQGLRMEALSLKVDGVNFCVQGHVENIGWQGWVCPGGGGGVTATVGTTGQGLRLEAVMFGVQVGTICGNAYVPDVGWQGWYCGVNGETNAVGSTGMNLRIEAVAFVVS